LGERRSVICRSIGALLIVLVLLHSGGAPALAEPLRVGALKNGTFGWELALIKARGLDRAAGLDLEVVDLANTEAGKIAIEGGSVDIVLADWLWVSRERSLGGKLTFYPYSSEIGAVMAPTGKPIAALADLKGKSLGVAGGPLDKSWLLLQAYAKRSGFDIARETHIVFGAPALLTEKAAQGELDAALLYWNFCIELELRGFHRSLDMSDVEKSLGVSAPLAMVGFVFNENLAAKNAAALTQFFDTTRKARDILTADKAEWRKIMASIGRDETAATLYRKRYSEGAPRSSIDDEQTDANILFGALAEAGGEELVGPSRALDPGTFFRPNGH
jgi:NitT/TauT family transport system substrate-binding protein